MTYRRTHLELKKKILNSKKDAWKTLVEQLDSDIWEKGYKIVTKKLGLAKKNAMLLEDLIDQAKRLFPIVQEVRWITAQRREGEEESLPMVTPTELKEASKKIRNGKAPAQTRYLPRS